jgi:hypothetical protein
MKGIIAAAAIGDVIDLIRSGCILLPADNNFSAMTDPSASRHYTQDFSVGSRWFNTLAGRAWVCLSAATGAAVWILDGVVPGVGGEPSNVLTYFGGGTGTFLNGGSLDRQVGNPVAGNNDDTTDGVLASYTLPASSLDVLGRGLCITARGMIGPTSNGRIHGGIGLPVIWTATEANAIVIAVTGLSYTADAANDLIATWFESTQ